MGVASPLAAVPSLALGTSDVTLLEMVSAYATMADGGLYRPPVLIAHIDDVATAPSSSGSRPSRAARSTPRSRSRSSTCCAASSTAAPARPCAAPFGVRGDVAGKTGTTQNGADGWFLAMHPDVVAGAWVGFDDPRVTFRSAYWEQGGHNALRVVGGFLQTAEQQSASSTASARFPDAPPLASSFVGRAGPLDRRRHRRPVRARRVAGAAGRRRTRRRARAARPSAATPRPSPRRPRTTSTSPRTTRARATRWRTSLPTTASSTPTRRRTRPTRPRRRTGRAVRARRGRAAAPPRRRPAPGRGCGAAGYGLRPRRGRGAGRPLPPRRRAPRRARGAGGRPARRAPTSSAPPARPAGRPSACSRRSRPPRRHAPTLPDTLRLPGRDADLPRPFYPSGPLLSRTVHAADARLPLARHRALAALALALAAPRPAPSPTPRPRGRRRPSGTRSSPSASPTATRPTTRRPRASPARGRRSAPSALRAAGWQPTPWTHDWTTQEPWARRLAPGEPYTTVFLRRYGGDVQGILDRLRLPRPPRHHRALPQPAQRQPEPPQVRRAGLPPRRPRHGARPGRRPRRHRARRPPPPRDVGVHGSRPPLPRPRPRRPRARHARRAGLLVEPLGPDAPGLPVRSARRPRRAPSPTGTASTAGTTRPRPTRPSSPTRAGPACRTCPSGARPTVTGDPAAGVPFDGDLAEPVAQHILAVSRRWLDPDGDGDPADGLDGFRLDVAEMVPLGFWRRYRARRQGRQPRGASRRRDLVAALARRP